MHQDKELADFHSLFNLLILFSSQTFHSASNDTPKACFCEGLRLCPPWPKPNFKIPDVANASTHTLFILFYNSFNCKRYSLLFILRFISHFGDWPFYRLWSCKLPGSSLPSFSRLSQLVPHCGTASFCLLTVCSWVLPPGSYKLQDERLNAFLHGSVFTGDCLLLVTWENRADCVIV